MRNENTHTVLRGMETHEAILENRVNLSQLACNSVILSLDGDTTEAKLQRSVSKGTCTMYVIVSFVVGGSWRQPRCNH